MPNINTTYFLFEKDSTVSLLNTMEADTVEICPPRSHSLPYTLIKNNENLLGNLLFTIIFLSIFAFVRLRGKDLFSNLLNILIKRKKAEIVLNEGVASNLICYILSLCLSFSILAVFITYIVWHNFITLYTLYIFGAFLLYHFILVILVKLLGWTFNARYTADEVIINLWTYNILAGLLIAPFVISIFFVKSFAIIPLLKFVIFSLIIFILVKFIRWVEILFSYRVSILYIILYLCALEFMPLLVLYKVVD